MQVRHHLRNFRKLFIHSGDKDDWRLIEYSKEKILEAIANSK